MRQAARMLGWVTNLTGFVLLCILLLVGYSLVDMIMYRQPITIRDTNSTGYERGVRYLIPFDINNTSPLPFHDVRCVVGITNLGPEVTGKEIYIPIIPGEKLGEGILVLEVDLANLREENVSILLSDSELEVETSIHFSYVRLLNFSVKPPNVPIFFKAPLHNISVTRPDVRYYNSTHHVLFLSISFENHSPLQIEIANIRIFNEKRQLLTSGKSKIDVLPRSGFRDSLCLFMDNKDLQRMTDRGFIELVFETPDFRFKRVEISYG